MTENNGIIFQNSITTNGYLMDKDRIKKFSEIGLNDFQITLDGDEITHNNIRFTKNGGGSFRRIIENINYLSEFDANTIVVRINYTEDTLKDVNNVIKLFSERAKSKIQVHFQQVWQDSFKRNISCEENKEFFRMNGLNVRPFELNKNYHVCYADRINQAVINYDGNVFKCTARDFATHTPDGKLMPDGKIEWDMPAISKRMGQATFENEFCSICKLLPVCMGPCSQKMMEFKVGDDFRRICLKDGIENILNEKIKEYNNTIIYKINV